MFLFRQKSRQYFLHFEEFTKIRFFLNQSKTHYDTDGITREGELSYYLADYKYVFKSHTSDLSYKAKAYIEALFLTERNKRNIERMSDQNGEHY